MPKGDTTARVLMVAGLGGSGRTTLSIALATHAAGRGATLLVTVGRVADPMLHDLAAPFSHVHLNPVELLSSWWASLSETVRTGRRLAGTSTAQPAGFDPFVMEPPELIGLADAEHLLTLRAIGRHAESGSYTTVIVDAPTLNELASMMSAPTAISAYLERIWPRHARLSGTASNARERPATGELAGLLVIEPLAGLAEELATFVGDRTRVELLYVLTADSLRVARAHNELATLELLALRPQALVLNRLANVDTRFALDLPHPAIAAAAKTIDTQRAARDAALALAGALARPLIDVVDTSALPHELTEGSLADQAAAIFAAAAPGANAEPTVTRIGGSGVDARYQWRMPLPLVDPTTIGLGRIEEDLLVSGQGVRRRVRLPSVLRRCVVGEATYSEGELRVTFAPDPQVWPQHAR